MSVGVWRYLGTTTKKSHTFLFAISQKGKIMGYLKLSLYQETAPSMYKVTNPEQYKLYKEVLTFDGGMSFASADELIVKKKDGTTFRSSLQHYESDFLTETYLGHFPNGLPFRFLFASASNPMAQLNPMISFAGMDKDGWAVHYRVHL